MFTYLGSGLNMPAKLFGIYKDFEELQGYKDLAEATEFMLDTYPSLSTQEFSKVINTEEFKNPSTPEKKLFKRLIREEFLPGNVYDPEVMRQKVRELALQSGLNVKHSKEKNLLECLVVLKRANKDNHLKVIKWI